MKSKIWWIHSRILWSASLVISLTILNTVSGLTCPTPSVTTPSEIMADRTALIGHWEKITLSPCSRVYPTQIEFHEDGFYVGTGAQAGNSPGWDVGTYEIVSLSQVGLSVANDAILTYEFAITDDILTLIDTDECEFQYQKKCQETR